MPVSKLQRVSPEQKTEWIESSVTLALKAEAKLEVERIQGSPLSDNLIRGEPQLTQENLVENVTKELEWRAFIDLLDGDWTAMEDDDDE